MSTLDTNYSFVIAILSLIMIWLVKMFLYLTENQRKQDNIIEVSKKNACIIHTAMPKDTCQAEVMSISKKLNLFSRY